MKRKFPFILNFLFLVYKHMPLHILYFSIAVFSQVCFSGAESFLWYNIYSTESDSLPYVMAPTFAPLI